MAQQRKVVWDIEALKALANSLEWISNKSPQQAEKVEEEILKRIEILKAQPERFPPDKYKRNNNGTFRAFETHSYRITYLYSKKEVQIIHVRHVKREPKEY